MEHKLTDHGDIVLVESLELLEIAQVVKEARESGGSYDLNSPEIQSILDEIQNMEEG